MLVRRRPDPVLLALFDEAGRNAHATSGLLRELLAVIPDPSGFGPQIRACEHEGDRIAHEILRRLAQRGGRRSHMDVTDVHALTMAIDDIVDHSEEAADELRPLRRGGPLGGGRGARRDSAGVHRAGHGGAARVPRGTEISTVRAEIHRLEKQADELLRDSVGSLFAAGIDPMMVIRWKDILETLEAAIDACEDGRQRPRGRKPQARRTACPRGSSTAAEGSGCLLGATGFVPASRDGRGLGRRCAELDLAVNHRQLDRGPPRARPTQPLGSCATDGHRSRPRVRRSGDARVHRRAAAGLRADVERAVERRHAVGEATQTAALRRIRSADPVVGDPDVDHLAVDGHHDACVGRARVPDDVRERFGDDEVDGRLDRLWQPAGRQRRDLDRQREALGSASSADAEPVLRQHRRVDAAGQLAQLAHRAVEVEHRRIEQHARRRGVTLQRASALSAGRWRA